MLKSGNRKQRDRFWNGGSSFSQKDVLKYLVGGVLVAGAIYGCVKVASCTNESIDRYLNAQAKQEAVWEYNARTLENISTHGEPTWK